MGNEDDKMLNIPQNVQQQQKSYNKIQQNQQQNQAIFYQKRQHDEPKKSSKNCIKSFVNVLIYGICVISLLLSLYLNYRQQSLELEIKNLINLDNKVHQIEVDLNELIRKTNRFTNLDDDDISIQNYNSNKNNVNLNNNVSVRRDHRASADDTKNILIDGYYEEIHVDDPPLINDASQINDPSIVKKLSPNIFNDLHRLKRDVSNLKMARRQRQTSIQQSPNDCLCPAGECFILL